MRSPSKTGAGLHDILHVLKRRDSSLPVIDPLLHRQQGMMRRANRLAKIELANKRNECDVLIVGRGGWFAGDFTAVLMMSVWRGRFLPVAFR
ncbi:exodeoxyribonuclease VII large subunit [Shigella sonnei]